MKPMKSESIKSEIELYTRDIKTVNSMDKRNAWQFRVKTGIKKDN